jgi:hypothetical protein
MGELARTLLHFTFVVGFIAALAYFTSFDPNWTLVMATLAWFETMLHRYEDD